MFSLATANHKHDVSVCCTNLSLYLYGNVIHRSYTPLKETERRHSVFFLWFTVFHKTRSSVTVDLKISAHFPLEVHTSRQSSDQAQKGCVDTFILPFNLCSIIQPTEQWCEALSWWVFSCPLATFIIQLSIGNIQKVLLIHVLQCIMTLLLHE